MTIMATDQEPLEYYRTELKLTQQELADAAGVVQPTISNIESRIPIARQTAYRVLHGLNRERAKQSLPRLRFEDVNWPLL